MTACMEEAVLSWRAQTGRLFLQHHKEVSPKAVTTHHSAA